MSPRLRWFVFFGILLTPLSAAGDMYIWTGEDGVIIIADKPPADSDRPVRIVRTGPLAPSKTATGGPVADEKAASSIEAAVRRVDAADIEVMRRMPREALKSFLAGPLAGDCDRIAQSAALSAGRKAALLDKCGVLQKFAGQQLFFGAE